MYTKKSMRGVSALTVTAALLAPAQVFAIEYYVMAAATSASVPSSTGGPDLSVPMWGYALCTSAGSGCGAVTVPGPELNVPAGDNTLTVHLLNGLPQATSLVINGLIKPMTPVWNDGTPGARPNLTARVRSFDAEAAPNGTADYTWINVKPGSYLYQSGTQPQVQVQMGLYGAITKNSTDVTLASPAQAYVGVPYDNQATLFYSEIDPTLHAAVADGSYGTAPAPTSTLNYQPKYFLINGKPYPASNSVISPAGSPGITLLRLFNAGLTTHVPMIQDTYWNVVAEDGKPYPYRQNQYTALLPAAKTLDVLLTPDAGGAVYPIIDRRLNLSNDGLSEGGMLAYLLYGATGAIGGGASGGNLPPVAVNDSYSSITGVTLSVGASEGVLINDDNTDGVPQPRKAVAASGTTSGGGSYTLNTNGSFAYTPLATFTGVDTFDYQLTDGQALSNTATVSITLSTPTAPTSLVVLDDFNRGTLNTLGANWSQIVSTNPPAPNLQVVLDQASLVTNNLGGLAIWNQSLLPATQGAAFSSASQLANSALILKATGGSTASPANYVRVRCETSNGGEVVVATMMGGSNISVYVKQGAFAAPGCNGGGSLSAVVDAKGLVTTFLNGMYAGGVQLPVVAAWQGSGRIGLQLQNVGAAVDNFSGGSAL